MHHKQTFQWGILNYFHLYCIYVFVYIYVLGFNCFSCLIRSLSVLISFLREMYSCWIIYIVFIGWIISAGASHPPNLNAFHINNAFTLPLPSEMRTMSRRENGKGMKQWFQKCWLQVHSVQPVRTFRSWAVPVAAGGVSNPLGEGHTVPSWWLLAHTPCKEVFFYEGDDSLAQCPGWTGPSLFAGAWLSHPLSLSTGLFLGQGMGHVATFNLTLCDPVTLNSQKTPPEQLR